MRSPRVRIGADLVNLGNRIAREEESVGRIVLEVDRLGKSHGIDEEEGIVGIGKGRVGIAANRIGKRKKPPGKIWVQESL